ncbi:hypothetical protein B0H17DRAFT_1217913 [Mycena rosella]|uniref:Uncharacterized protein n=1 Tax=Mycena rosella TaxID=1033263 RepID=A0AAD7BV01_MYCRO|nr:hypothetical protein B0H17DRAFT_1217913 [Mycena rosella]
MKVQGAIRSLAFQKFMEPCSTSSASTSWSWVEYGADFSSADDFLAPHHRVRCVITTFSEERDKEWFALEKRQRALPICTGGEANPGSPVQGTGLTSIEDGNAEGGAPPSITRMDFDVFVDGADEDTKQIRGQDAEDNATGYLALGSSH